MSKIETLRCKFWSNPVPSDLSWREFTKIMRFYGYVERPGDGSRRKFVKDLPSGELHRVTLHKRHPDPTLLEYQIKQVRRKLIEIGVES